LNASVEKPPIRPVHVVSFRADAGMAAGTPPEVLAIGLVCTVNLAILAGLLFSR
jgi:hypothetical protein